MGESASSELTLGRCSSFWRERDLQWRTACSKVSGEARHLGQREGRSRLNVRHAKTLVHTHGPLRSAQTQRRDYATVSHHL